MKINIKNFLMAAAAVLVLCSCSEGKYWTEPADKGDVVAFAKPAATVSVSPTGQAPSSYTVTLYRSQTASEQTVNVEFTPSESAADVLSGASSVTFKAGENTADYVISIGSLIPGMNYSAKLSVTNPENALTHVNSQNLSFTFSISQALSWTAAGEAAVQSSNWVGNETPMNVKVEEGNWPIAGQRLFRLIDVYYVLEPEYAEQGTELRFFTDDDGNALELFQAWTYMGEMYDDEYCFFGCPAQYGGQFISEGNEYLMQGVIGTAASLTGDVAPGWYENLYFVWDCPAK